MNLGVANEAMGRTSQALGYYERSLDVYRQLGSERRAAEQEVNSVSLQVALGAAPGEVARRLTNALATLRALGHVDFEVAALQAQGDNEAGAGRLAEAKRILHEATTLATERGLKNRLLPLRVATANVAFLEADYEGARKILVEALAEGSTEDVHLALGRVLVRVGNFDGARQHFETARARLRSSGVMVLEPLLEESLGELFREMGREEVARQHFRQAVSMLEQHTPIPAGIEAECHLGVMPETLSRVHNVHVRAECALERARVEFQAGRYTTVTNLLHDIPPSDANIGLELQARVHYWSALALARQGQAAASSAERDAGRRLAAKIQASLSEKDRASFARRATMRPLLD
jgi:tetratricopeptide (TPR) repeat protein